MEKWIRQKLGLSEGDFPAAPRLIQLAYLRLLGFVISVIGWVLCLTAMGMDEWRVWFPMPGIDMGQIWVGIWGICLERPEAEPTERQCLEFLDEQWSLPIEVFVTQDLMSLACIVGSLGLVFVSFSLWKLFQKVKPKIVLLTFFWVGGVLNLFSGLIMLIPLLWNMQSVLVKEGIVFPEGFYLPYLPYEQEIGSSILGISSSGFLISSTILILSEKCWFRFNGFPRIIMVMPKDPNGDTEPCPCCGSAISLEIYRSEEQYFNV